MPTAPIPKDSKEKRLLAAARSFAGSEGGKLLIEFLSTAAGMKRPVFQARPDGHVCPYIAAAADGRRSLYLDLEQLISRAKADENEEENRPKARR